QEPIHRLVNGDAEISLGLGPPAGRQVRDPAQLEAGDLAELPAVVAGDRAIAGETDPEDASGRLPGSEGDAAVEELEEGHAGVGCRPAADPYIQKSPVAGGPCQR